MKIKRFLQMTRRKIKSLFYKRAEYKNMRNVIIFGEVRTGKSTLALKCHTDLGYSVVDSDLLVNAFTRVYPNLGIINGDFETKKNLKKFLYEILNGLYSSLPNNITIIPISQTTLGILKNYKNLDYYIVIVLGYSNITPEKLAYQIRHYEQPYDWTKGWDDEHLLNGCKYIIEESKKNEKLCKKYGFYYFDMSNDLPGTQNKIVQFIKEINVKRV